MGAEALELVEKGEAEKELANTKAELTRARELFAKENEARRLSLSKMIEPYTHNNSLTDQLRGTEVRAATLEGTLKEKYKELAKLRGEATKREIEFHGVACMIVEQRQELKEAKKAKTKLEVLKKLAEMKRADHEKVELQLTKVKGQLKTKEEERAELAGHLEETKPVLAELEGKLSDLQSRLPHLEAQAVESFYQKERPLLGISDSFLT